MPEVMLVGRTLQVTGLVSPDTESIVGSHQSSTQGQPQPLTISKGKATAGRGDTHLVLQKAEPHFFKRLLVCLETEPPAAS